MPKKSTLSLLIIAKNSSHLLKDAIKSVENLADEIIIIDNNSTDNTREQALNYTPKVYSSHSKNLGYLKQLGLEKCTCDWILSLDTDERISKKLKEEIEVILTTDVKKIVHSGFIIPFQNHFLNIPIKHGGENYKMLRLFKRKKGRFTKTPIHEKVKVEGKIAQLKGKIYHFSYRSLSQTFKKFSIYALKTARIKFLRKEKLTLKKLFLYSPHMFFARYIKDKGYKDHPLRIILDLLFAYMELATYWLLLYFKAREFLLEFICMVKRSTHTHTHTRASLHLSFQITG